MALAQPSADQARVEALGQAAKAGYVAAAAQPIARPAAAAPTTTSATMAQASHAAASQRISASPSDLNCLAAAVYYEARGESPAGRAAVAQVVLNRVHRAAFPKSVCGVVFQGQSDGECQFSFACNGAMRARREPAAWINARAVAARALAGYVMTTVGKAAWFHCARGDGRGRGVRLGSQVFLTTLVSDRPAKPRRQLAEATPAIEDSTAHSVSATTKTAS